MTGHSLWYCGYLSRVSILRVIRVTSQWVRWRLKSSVWPFLLNRLFRCRSQKTSKLRVTGLCEGNSTVTSEIPAQRASNAENVSIWWRHHVTPLRYRTKHNTSKSELMRSPIVYVFLHNSPIRDKKADVVDIMLHTTFWNHVGHGDCQSLFYWHLVI